MNDFGISVLALLVALGLPVIVFLTRSFLVAYINQKVRADFEARIASIRSDFRKSEEQLRADLRVKESRIATLADAGLSAQSRRQERIATRRSEALESIWLKFHALSPLKAGAMFYQTLQIEKVEKAAVDDPNVKQFLSMIPNGDLSEVAAEIKLTFERIYVPDIVWAVFSAYSSILFTIALHLQAMKLGLEDSGKFITWDKVFETVKAVLPHQSEFIDKYGQTALPLLLDEVEGLMLREIRNAMNSEEEDKGSLEQAKKILGAAEDLTIGLEVQKNALSE